MNSLKSRPSELCYFRHVQQSFLHTRITLGTFFGVPVLLEYSWFSSFVVLTWFIALGIIIPAFPALSVVLVLLVSSLVSLAFFASILVHELAHAVLAKRHGLAMQSVVLYLMGGAVELVDEPTNPVQERKVSIVGPAVNIVLAGLFFVGVYVTAGPTSSLWLLLAQLNIMVGLFNLLPVFPLDGGRVVRSWFWQQSGDYTVATRRAVLVSRLVANGIVFLGLGLILVSNYFVGIWCVLIGLFLDRSAKESYHQFRWRDVLGKFSLREAMQRVSSHPRSARFSWQRGITLQSSLSLFDALVFMQKHKLKELAIFEKGRCVGVLSGERLVQFLRQQQKA